MQGKIGNRGRPVQRIPGYAAKMNGRTSGRLGGREDRIRLTGGPGSTPFSALDSPATPDSHFSASLPLFISTWQTPHPALKYNPPQDGEADPCRTKQNGQKPPPPPPPRPHLAHRTPTNHGNPCFEDPRQEGRCGGRRPRAKRRPLAAASQETTFPPSTKRARAGLVHDNKIARHKARCAYQPTQL